MGLELYYPKEKFKLESASMPNTGDSNGVFKINPTLQEIIDNNNDLLVTDDSGIIRVVFATTNIFDVAGNDIMIYLGFRPLYELEPGELDFKLFGTGIIADQYGEEAKDEDYLLMPKIFVQGNHSEAAFDFTGYPNPFKGSTTLTYNLPENGKVKLSVYNTLGVCVAELVNESQMSGKHTVVFSTDNQQTAIYTVRLDFFGEQNSNCAILKMTHFK
ncbi:MAG TPA: T9SS type A sorting domain-containing protein [Bacteroidales bacterium]|nr:T9SS type A sorting domain-containing protein [Bacteroidales bacterium]HQP16263.1 T9SS type A sorting domain-containing protein [Bacteroidales bacterium]